MIAPEYADRISALGERLGLEAGYAQTRQLMLVPEAVELVTARVLRNGRELQLTPAAARAWSAMTAAAAAEQITLLLLSGFRSVDYQLQIIERKLHDGQTLDQILRVNAAPGYSEHHTGRAVDIGTPGCPPLVEEFEQTAAFAWLSRRAGEFGFSLSYPRHNPHGFIYEPWHWLFRPMG